MIILKDNVREKMNSWTDDSVHILTDFDRTITVGKSDSSWGILSKSDSVPKDYIKERSALYNHYRPIELDENMDIETKNALMSEWWNSHIDLLIKYQMSEEVINNAALDLRVLAFREGAKEFLEDMKNRNIPVIIISAGIGNFIHQFLIKNNCYYDNIYIVSNFLKFENGVVVGVNENIIHSLNKNEVSLPQNICSLIANRPNIILLGDAISDIKMASEDKRLTALKIGFLEKNIEENIETFKNNFDVICTDDTNYFELAEVLNNFKFGSESNE